MRPPHQAAACRGRLSRRRRAPPAAPRSDEGRATRPVSAHYPPAGDHLAAVPASLPARGWRSAARDSPAALPAPPVGWLENLPGAFQSRTRPGLPSLRRGNSPTNRRGCPPLAEKRGRCERRLRRLLAVPHAGGVGEGNLVQSISATGGSACIFRPGSVQGQE